MNDNTYNKAKRKNSNLSSLCTLNNIKLYNMNILLLYNYISI